MNTSSIVKALTLAGKIAAVATGFAGALDPKIAAIVFVVCSIVKDVANTLVSFLGAPVDPAAK